jgi:hypothetical protein
MSEKKSINVKCISECYSKNDIVIHPLLLIPITDNNNDFCLTLPYNDNDNKIKYTYICKNNNKNNIKNNLLIQNIHINSEVFLNYIYNINNFKEGINWIENNINISENTINRFLNNFWNVYINEIKYNYNIIINIYLKYIKIYNKQILINNKNNLNDDKLKEYIDKSLNRIFAKYGKKEKKSIEYNNKIKKYINYYLNEKKK